MFTKHATMLTTCLIVYFPGGAEISNSGSSCLIKVVSSDNPHGVFSFSQPLYKVRESKGDDSVTSLTDFTSSIQVMVIRSKGRTGRVRLRLCRFQEFFFFFCHRYRFNGVRYNSTQYSQQTWWLEKIWSNFYSQSGKEGYKKRWRPPNKFFLRN